MIKYVNKKMASLAGAALIVATMGLGGAANAQTFYGYNDPNLKAGMEAITEGNLETASEYLAKAARSINGGERQQIAYSNLCAVDLALGRLDSAKDACDTAIRFDKRDWRAFVNRGHLNRLSGDTDAALADYRRAAKLNPESELAGRVLARMETSLQSKQLASND
ncbi:hypothetical protein [Gimibacter soli]|uniref:Tetratricopeptide repeat protein n=1 Tax=Gimibacter soli TaxID=3024400 RepID=A0AAF0BK70_9PROT|nr:hypothetical protein [Gimibacter soli]WCL52622.1 hypothetical protein PH603_08730 [Gimibacter soli]